MSLEIQKIIDDLPIEYQNSKIYLLRDIFVENLASFRDKVVKTFSTANDIKDFFFSLHAYYSENNCYPDMFFIPDLHRCIILIPQGSINDLDHEILLESTQKLESLILFV